MLHYSEKVSQLNKLLQGKSNEATPHELDSQFEKSDTILKVSTVYTIDTVK